MVKISTILLLIHFYLLEKSIFQFCFYAEAVAEVVKAFLYVSSRKVRARKAPKSQDS